MNVAEQKLNLFRQIDTLPEELLNELEKMIHQLQTAKNQPAKRQFGCMKGLIVEMADDFDAP